MALCAGIIGVAGIFLFFGMGSLVLAVAAIATLVLLLSLALHGFGSFINQKFKINTRVKRICLVLPVLLIALVMVCGVVYTVQDGMIFYNVMDSESRDFLAGRPGFREVQFTAENGKTYHGMMYQTSGEAAPLVIYFGGNGEVSYRNLRNREEQGQWRYFPGYHYLFIDYEGYGINNSKTHYLNMYEQALVVYDYAAALPGVDNKHIVAMGYSLGSGSAVYLAANRPVAALILAAPYANGYDFYNNIFPIFYGPTRLLVKQKLPSDEYAPNVTCPVLIIASRSDETIPFSSSQRLSERFGGDVEFMTLNDALHNSIFQTDGVFSKIQFFLEKVAAK